MVSVLRRLWKRKWIRVLLLSLVAAVALSVVDYFAYPYGGELAGKSFNRGANGLWLRYTWYFGKHTPSDLEQLVERLESAQVRYAYFHVRFLRHDGALAYRHPEFRSLVDELHRRRASTKALAWIYVDGSVAIGDPVTRRRAVDEAAWLVQTCGFDGVQWDYEPCPDGSRAFLRLLEETRAALGSKTVSVAAPTWFPWPLGGAGWSEAYFGEVGKRCDQIAVMCYDTGFVTPRAYEWLVEEQGRRIPAAAECEILLGLPTYSAGGPSHNPRAESLGIGLMAARHCPRIAGVALFADYTTDDAEWSWYARAWSK